MIKHLLAYPEQKSDYLSLSITLVYQKNKYRFTSITIKEYQQILKSIDFMLQHAIKEGTLKERYDDGYQQVQKLIQSTRLQMKQLQKQQRALPNERYRSILTQQLPDFFTHYDPDYHAVYCKEDLDYPLLYGLFLEHDMYGKQGIDLVAYYLECFEIEESFLLLFQKDLELFLHDYEIHVGVELEMLGINFTEIVLTQALFAFYLKKKHGLFLNEEQRKELIRQLKQDDLDTCLPICFSCFLSKLPQSMVSYLEPYEKQWIEKLNLACLHGTFESLIVIHKHSTDRKPQILTTCDGTLFTQMLRSLEECEGIKRIQKIMETKLGYYDFIDLFEMDILSKKEYFLLYDALDPMSLAYLFYEHFKEAHVFHQKLQLDESLLSNIDCSYAWECYFITYLMQCPLGKKQKLSSYFMSLL